MPPKFAKKDRVKVLATRFDKEEVEEGELKFSEKWMEGFNDIMELPGVGKYGKESWDIFVNGRKDIEPTDKKLKKYLEDIG